MQSGKEQGFTLVEVLTAIVILLFGLVAIANLFVVAMMSNSVAQVSTAATARATERMEQLTAMSIGGTQAGPKLSDAGGPAICAAADVSEMGLAGAQEKRARVRTTCNVTLVDATDPLSSVYYIRVQSEGASPLMGSRSRIVLTTFRTQAPPE